MKLLRVTAAGFKNCREDFTIDFASKAPISIEDETYELTCLDEDLYVQRSAIFVGKNASGKTSALDLLNLCYELLGTFRLKDTNRNFSNLKLTMFLYHEKMLYRYESALQVSDREDRSVIFRDEHLAVKPYRKSKRDAIYLDEDYQEREAREEMPEDVSMISRVMKKQKPRAFYLRGDREGIDLYRDLFETLQNFETDPVAVKRIIRLFDPNIVQLEFLTEASARLTLKGKTLEVSARELTHILSAGTLRGILLYLYVYHSLKRGMDLLVDEPEIHLHKSLLGNILNLFQDKRVNTYGASFYFSTQYAEILDYPARSDGIWIAKAEGGVHLENMYETGLVRPNQNKDRLYYENAFHTAVDYEDIVSFKETLFNE